MKFLDTDDPKLNLKVYIRHRSATLNKRIRMPKKKMMIIPRETQPTTNASKYLIITSPTRYNNNIPYYFSTHEIGFVTVLEKKKQRFYPKLVAQDVWDQIFRNEYHEEKKRVTKGMSLSWSICIAHSKAKIWFVSETLWSVFLWGLDRVFAVFYVKNK